MGNIISSSQPQQENVDKISEETGCKNIFLTFIWAYILVMLYYDKVITAKLYIFDLFFEFSYTKSNRKNVG